MIIEARLNDLGNYLVRLGDSLYEANNQAHMPNGLWMYRGSYADCRARWNKCTRLVQDSVVYYIPIGIAQAIANQVERDKDTHEFYS